MIQEHIQYIIDNGGALKYIREDLKSLQLCQLAVERNGLALNYVPHYMKTNELCTQAVKSDGFAIRHVPLNFKTIGFVS